MQEFTAHISINGINLYLCQDDEGTACLYPADQDGVPSIAWVDSKETLIAAMSLAWTFTAYA